MNNVLFNILNNVDEGIVILDAQLKIYIWNNYMETITNIHHKDAIGNDVYGILPSLNKEYFKKTLYTVLNNGSKMFFSAAMHKGMLNTKENLNLKITRIDIDESVFLLLEFIDVTNQFKQINILKNYIQELSRVNTELKEKESVIKKLAYYDKLTGVANRTLFYEFAEKFLDAAKRENTLLGLMFIDVDNFKKINDTYGHEAGDNVLVGVANILNDSTRKNDIVARYGGDEFLILLPNMKDYDSYKPVFSRIVNNENKTVTYDGKNIEISLSIGVSFYPRSADSVDKLIVEADKSMYIAKNRGRRL